MKNKNCDVLIIGAGVIGLCIAKILKENSPKSKILIIEKEDEIAFHSSGRNSGVLHAGFYYTADSMKAKFTKQGCAYWKNYCEENSIKKNDCGKVVVTRNEEELESLTELFKRAEVNGVDLQEIDAKSLKELEPRAITHKKAGWSPSTSTVNPKEVMQSLYRELIENGVEVSFSTSYLDSKGNTVKTNSGSIEAGYVINAAGLHADTIARKYGFSSEYRILPFKGLYLYADKSAPKFKRHIYPVPNLHNPFLGVHHTLTVDGESKIGPTAIPALWREQYNGLTRFDIQEFIQILGDEISLMFSKEFDFKNLAMQEIKKYSRTRLVNESAEMATDVHLKNYTSWGKPGIRAQLFHTKKRKLEMDFIFEFDKDSLHVLNAVSPAFTCAMPFSEYLLKESGMI